MSEEVNKLVAELLQLYEEDGHRPFPYAGCRTILRQTGKRFEGFIPDLALYFSDIAGYCRGARRLLKWPGEKIAEAQRKLQCPFFVKHPEYAALEEKITATEPPDLYSDIALHEEMRAKLLTLLALLSTQRPSPSLQPTGC